MERLVHATRSRGIVKPTTESSRPGGKVPVAVRQLQSGSGWTWKKSGCKLPSLEPTSPEQCKDPDINVAATIADEIQEAKEQEEPFFRFFGETTGVRDLITEAALCSSCKRGKLEVTFESKCLATTIHTRCMNCQYALCIEYIFHGNSPG